MRTNNSTSDVSLVYEKRLSSLKSILGQFTSNIIDEFNLTSESLHQVYQKKEIKKDKIINQQRVIIEKMKNFVESYQNIIKIINHSPNENIQTQQKIIASSILQQSLVQKRAEMVSEQNIYVKLQEVPIIQKQPTNTLSRPSNDIQPGSITKQPLQCSKTHKLYTVKMKPNITFLKYSIQYLQSRQITFDQSQVKKLEDYDLTMVESVVIDQKKMNDLTFQILTSLSWGSLKSLRISNNMITDITCLTNIGCLAKLQQFDVSWNPLSQESAFFLSTYKFDEMIYLTISFEQNFSEQSWNMMISTKMSNYPKLQAIDIYNSNYLTQKMKFRILYCLEELSLQQKIRSLNYQLQLMYPQDYKIKLTWAESKDLFAAYPQQKMKQINQEWLKSFSHDGKRLKSLPIKYANTTPQRTKKMKSIQKKEHKTKIIQKKGSRSHRVRKEKDDLSISSFSERSNGLSQNDQI